MVWFGEVRCGWQPADFAGIEGGSGQYFESSLGTAYFRRVVSSFRRL